MSRLDLALLHAPSVHDFRERPRLFGPISDLIPSSPIFEMYPVGFATMAAYLEERGWRVRIVNLAYRMLKDEDFDVATFLRDLRPRMFGLDLHWLPHAHGALEVARLVKSLHPDIPVVCGGFSASYFSQEVVSSPHVDYVIAGATGEHPMHCLLETLDGRRARADVPDLVWQSDGKAQKAEKSWSPRTLDHANFRPGVMMRQVLRYQDVASITPYGGWWRDPVVPVMTVKGCSRDCATCGGSCSGFYSVTGEERAIPRTPGNAAENVRDIAMFSRGPIFLIGDLRQGGSGYADELLGLLADMNIRNECVFELFSPADREFLSGIGDAVSNWTLELSPESHDRDVREVHDPSASYSNREMEATIGRALEAGCGRVDVFFMIGLARQTASSVMETVEYAGRLMDRFGENVSCYISPLAPFLDPGSRAYENPDELGYTVLASTLEEHRRLLENRSWGETLNYRTEWMDRDEIVDVTYRAGERLNELKMHHGQISPAIGREVEGRIKAARELRGSLRDGDATDVGPSGQGVETVADWEELAWRRRLFNFRPLGIARQLLGL